MGGLGRLEVAEQGGEQEDGLQPPATTEGAPTPVLVSWRSLSLMRRRSSMMASRISPVDAPPVMSPRISANFVSASAVSPGSTIRSGISTSSKWFR